MVYVAGLRGLLPTLGLIYGFQAACAAFAVPAKTEKVSTPARVPEHKLTECRYSSSQYYDLCGSLGFISATAFSLFVPHLRTRFPKLAFLGGSAAAQSIKTAALKATSATSAPWPPTLSSLHPRQLIMTSLAMFWAFRLGSFLFQRVKKAGSDPRFDEIKQDPAKFFGAWMMQATWISITALPIYLINSIPPAAQAAFGRRPTDYIGLAIWLAGMGLEIVADREKSQWRQDKEDKKHDESFITRGTWSWSRHPK